MEIVFAIPGFSTDSKSKEGKQVRAIIQSYLSHIGDAVFSPGAVTFKVADAFGPYSTATDNATALKALMRLLTHLDLYWLKNRKAVPRLYESGVYYDRTNVWYTIPALYQRGRGDCKSLAAARVAELLYAGVKEVQPVFRFADHDRGVMFHILVMYPNGVPEDPSKILGMEAYREKTG